MPTWIVTDSRGKRHEVTADYIAGASGEKTFVVKGEPNLGIVAAFTAPVAVMPKGESGYLIPSLAFLAKIWRKYA